MGKISSFNQFAPQTNVEQNTSKNAVIYTRVSHSSQEDNTSLETQKQRCEEFAKNNNYTVVDYFGGTSESAKTDDRKEFNRMITFVKRSKNVNFIIVYSYERFSRTGADGMKIAQDLQKQYRVTTLSASQGIDPTTITGEFQRNIMLLFGHLDNQMRIDKTINGMRDMVVNGYTPYSIPFGYVNLNKGQKAKYQKIVLSEEGKLLRKAFHWKADKQMRNSEIVKRLNELGLKINDRKIGQIFANPYYCGILVSKLIPNQAYEGNHEAMVSKELFLKVNGIIQEKRVHPVSYKEDDEKLPLKRFARCSECNTPLTGYIVKKKNLWYYKCRTVGCGTNKSANQLHEQFKSLISVFKVEDEYSELIKIGVTQMYKSVIDEISENQTQYKIKISEIKKKIDTAEENLVTGVINRELFDKFNSKFNQEITQIQNELSKIEKGSSNLEKCIELVMKFCRNPLEWWERATIGHRMIFQNMLFPNGISYDRKNDIVRTQNVNCFFQPIPALISSLSGNKKGEMMFKNHFSYQVTSSGVKPETFRAVI